MCASIGRKIKGNHGEQLVAENVVAEERVASRDVVDTNPDVVQDHPVSNVSYADVARASEGGVATPVAHVPDENDLPNRPLTTFFNPSSFAPADDVFTALAQAGVDSSGISCTQRQSSGEKLRFVDRS